MSTKLTDKQISSKLKKAIRDWKRINKLTELFLIDSQTATQEKINILKGLGFK